MLKPSVRSIWSVSYTHLDVYKRQSTDRLELAKLLNISDLQMSDITNVGAGQVLLKVGSSLVPFVNKFPRNTELYKLMTTKFGEVEERRSFMADIKFRDTPHRDFFLENMMKCRVNDCYHILEGKNSSRIVCVVFHGKLCQ